MIKCISKQKIYSLPYFISFFQLSGHFLTQHYLGVGVFHSPGVQRVPVAD